jgi:uncharacterized Zn finger protein (UPF0148 family)
MDVIYNTHIAKLNAIVRKVKIFKDHIRVIDNDMGTAGDEKKALIDYKTRKQEYVDKYNNTEEELNRYILASLKYITRKKEDGETNDLLVEFLQELHPNIYYENRQGFQQVAFKRISNKVEKDTCPECGSDDMEYEEGGIYCKKCGIGYKKAFIDQSFASFNNETHTITRSFKYKRINHFREYLHQMQGKSKIKMDKAALRRVRKEIKKYGKRNSEVTRPLLENIMSRLKITNWREKVAFMAGELHGNVDVLDINYEEEEELCRAFRKVEHAFCTIKDKVLSLRKNFMSYPFVGCKLCQKFGYKDKCKYFRLLKSPLLHINQERMWKLVCTS